MPLNIHFNSGFCALGMTPSSAVPTMTLAVEWTHVICFSYRAKKVLVRMGEALSLVVKAHVRQGTGTQACPGSSVSKEEVFFLQFTLALDGSSGGSRLILADQYWGLKRQRLWSLDYPIGTVFGSVCGHRPSLSMGRKRHEVSGLPQPLNLSLSRGAGSLGLLPGS